MPETCVGCWHRPAHSLQEEGSGSHASRGRCPTAHCGPRVALPPDGAKVAVCGAECDSLNVPRERADASTPCNVTHSVRGVNGRVYPRGRNTRWMSPRLVVAAPSDHEASRDVLRPHGSNLVTTNPPLSSVCPVRRPLVFAVLDSEPMAWSGRRSPACQGRDSDQPIGSWPRRASLRPGNPHCRSLPSGRS